MPYVHTTVSTKLDDAKREALSNVFRALSIDVLAKPAEYVMTAFNDETPMAFQHTTEPCANIRVEVCGDYPPGAPAKMTAVITAAVVKECGVKADRVFVMYYNTPHVGWNGVNF